MLYFLNVTSLSKVQLLTFCDFCGGFPQPGAICAVSFFLAVMYIIVCRGWQSQYDNNLITDQWEGPRGCRAVSDRACKKRLAGRWAVRETEVWLSLLGSRRALAGRLSSPSVSMWQLDKQPVMWEGKHLPCDVGETVLLYYARSNTLGDSLSSSFSFIAAVMNYRSKSISNV